MINKCIIELTRCGILVGLLWQIHRRADLLHLIQRFCDPSLKCGWSILLYLHALPQRSLLLCKVKLLLYPRRHQQSIPFPVLLLGKFLLLHQAQLLRPTDIGKYLIGCLAHRCFSSHLVVLFELHWSLYYLPTAFRIICFLDECLGVRIMMWV